MMSKVFIFVFALAILNANAQNVVGGYTPYSDSSAGGTISQSGFAPSVTTVADVADPYKSHEDFKAKFEIYGKNNLKLTTTQIQNAKTIVDSVTALFKSTKSMANARLCAYLVATAYVDSNLVPSEEKLSTKAELLALQTPYFDVKLQGRGYAHFTGSFNYNRFGQYIGEDIAAQPELLMIPELAAKVLAYGAVYGKFTGLKMSRFIPESGNADFVAARRSINGDVNADKIAKFVQEILA